MTDFNPPKIIALCGHPGAGKTEAQKILAERFGVIPIDDGFPMRDFAMRHLGLSLDDVTTQDGKAKTIVFAGKAFTVRWFLGELGNSIEALLGADAIPMMAARQLEHGKVYSVGSVRRDQGRVWKNFGAVVLEITNPLAQPSPHEFDRYDVDQVDVTIKNYHLAFGFPPDEARADLTAQLDQLMSEYFGQSPAKLGN